MTDDLHHVVLTSEGKEKAEQELHYLKTEKRKQVAEKIEAAKEMGDISENAEYAAAKDEQAFMEARVAELENILAYAEVVSAPESGAAVVMVGSTVEVKMADGTTRTFTVVGYNEANPSEGKISNESPLGHGLMAKHVGDAVSVETPSGLKTYTIQSIT